MASRRDVLTQGEVTVLVEVVDEAIKGGIALYGNSGEADLAYMDSLFRLRAWAGRKVEMSPEKVEVKPKRKVKRKAKVNRPVDILPDSLVSSSEERRNRKSRLITEETE